MKNSERLKIFVLILLLKKKKQKKCKSDLENAKKCRKILQWEVPKLKKNRTEATFLKTVERKNFEYSRKNFTDVDIVFTRAAKNLKLSG